MILQLITVIFIFLSSFNYFYELTMYDKIDYFEVKDKMIILKDEINLPNQMLFSLDLTEKTKKYSEVYIYIDSGGGELFTAYDMISLIKNSKSEIVCIAGNAYSSAFVLFQFCDRRLVTSKTKLLIHEASLADITFDYLMTFYDELEDMHYKYKITNLKIAKKLNITYEEYKKKIRKEWIMKGYDCIKNNAADKIIRFINFEN